MAVHFRTAKVKFDRTRHRVQSEQGYVQFDGNVVRANAAIKGFHIRYSDGDRPFFKQEIDVRGVSIKDNVVHFTVDFLIRDSSGNIDDPYEGWVNVLVVAVVKSRGADGLDADDHGGDCE